eukprot:TRINITY_DN152_c0_g1_i3.p1 TRINITY_DN152_c0_g1~~TRINITY_DN152_c0_g1_i3.p1  ORF type:complete len:710 (+),score=205.35 TRINITY_DN152_c0_g1_i3:246-2375(+)
MGVKGKKATNLRNLRLGTGLALLGCALLTAVLYRDAMSGDSGGGEVAKVKEAGLKESAATLRKEEDEMLKRVQQEMRQRFAARLAKEVRGEKVSKTCPHRRPSYRLTHDGRKCILPFQVYDTWKTDCDLGLCAVRVDALSRALEMSNCTSTSYTHGPLQCSHISEVSSCASSETLSTAGCDYMLGGKNIQGVCHCTGTDGGRTYTVNKLINCDTMLITNCNEICNTIQEDAMASGHSLSKLNEDPGIITKLADMASTNKPASNVDVGAWVAYAEELPKLANYTSQWCGKGIAIMAGSVNTLPQALATVSYLRGHFQSTVPVEIWQTKDEETTFSPDFQRALSQLTVTIRTIPEVAKSATTNEMFALKPAVVLASSFDTVLLLDADSIPLVDPVQLFNMRVSNVTGVFWPDYWTLLWDAKIWESIGGWPFGDQKYVPSQDSGLMVVCKSCGGWKPLALAFFFNYYSDVYYTAIYNGHWQEKQCRGGTCTKGHDVPGVGDKDTFQIAWMAFKEPYTMLMPASIGGTMLPKRRLICGSSFIHRNQNHEAVALHHNSNKWWWRDFVSGRWTHWHTGLLLTHVTSFVNASAAYFADGMNDWRSITYSTRYDAGRQQPPPGSRWCIVYKGQLKTSRVPDDIGWDIERVLVEYYTKLYSAPWLVEWATLASGGSGMINCVKQAQWQTISWLETASDEDVRNTVISHLTDLGLGRYG